MPLTFVEGEYNFSSGYSNTHITPTQKKLKDYSKTTKEIINTSCMIFENLVTALRYSLALWFECYIESKENAKTFPI